MADLRVPLYAQEKDASKCTVAVTGEFAIVCHHGSFVQNVERHAVTGLASQEPPDSSLDLSSPGYWQLVRQRSPPRPDLDDSSDLRDDSSRCDLVITVCSISPGHTVHGTVRDPNKESSVGHLKALPGAAQRLKLFAADLLEVPLVPCQQALSP